MTKKTITWKQWNTLLTYVVTWVVVRAPVGYDDMVRRGAFLMNRLEEVDS